MPAWTVRTISYHPPHGTPSFMAFPTYKPSHSCGFYDKFCFMPINPFIHFPMAHRWSDRFFSGNLLMLLVSSAQLPALHKSLGSPPKNRALPRSSSTSNNSSSSRPSRQRGANEVQTRSEITFWETDPLSLLTNSLVATFLRILFRTVKLKSFQRWSMVEQKRKPSQAAAAGKSKETEEETKGE